MLSEDLCGLDLVALHFTQRGLAETSHAKEITFRTAGQLANGQNSRGFQTVARPHRQIKFGDAHAQFGLQICVDLGFRTHDLRNRLVNRVRTHFIIENEGIEMLSEDLCGLDQGIFGLDGAIGPNLHDKSVIVGALAHSRVLRPVANPRNR